jgi:hypothetical protein
MRDLTNPGGLKPGDVIQNKYSGSFLLFLGHVQNKCSFYILHIEEKYKTFDSRFTWCYRDDLIPEFYNII